MAKGLYGGNLWDWLLYKAGLLRNGKGSLATTFLYPAQFEHSPQLIFKYELPALAHQLIFRLQSFYHFY